MRIQPTSRPGTEIATVDEERYPVPDPGLEPHLPRLTDVDEKAADRATRQVATFFGLVPVLSIGFAVVYFAVPGDAYIDFGPLRANTRNLLLGLTFGLALLFLGVGAVQWARKLMDDREMIDYRHGASSSDDDKTYMLTELDKAADEAQLTRRKIIGRTLHCRNCDDPAAHGRRTRRPWAVADEKEARRDHRADHLGARRSSRQRRHVRTDQAREY